MCVCVCGPTRRGKRTNQQRSSMCSLPLSSAGQLWCMGVWTCGGGTCRHVNGSIRETSNPHACIPTTAVDIAVGAVVKSGRFLATYLGACGAVQRAEKLTATDPTTAMFGFKRRRDQKRAPPTPPCDKKPIQPGKTCCPPFACLLVCWFVGHWYVRSRKYKLVFKKNTSFVILSSGKSRLSVVNVVMRQTLLLW